MEVTTVLSSVSENRKRRRGMLLARDWVVVVWGLFNYFEVGCPVSPQACRSAARRCAQAAWLPIHDKHALNLFNDIWRFCRVKVDDSPNRGVASVLEHLQHARASEYSHSFLPLSELAKVARPVVLGRISLPEEGAVIDPAKHLRGEKLQQFLEMGERVPLPHEEFCKRPKACHLVRTADEVVFARDLLENNLALLIPEEHVLKDALGRPVTAGFFAVPHKPETDRIITDRRPQNSTEDRLEWAELPQGCLLCQLILHDDESVRGSGDDISNYFHLLKHRHAWVCRNAVGNPLPGEQLVKYGAVEGRKYFLGLKTVPMGDLNGVCIAQATHEAILEEANCMRPRERLAYGKVVPSGDTWEGLYIDDHIVIQQYKKCRKTAQRPLRDENIMRDSRAHYASLHVPVSAKKAFTFEHSFVAWGTSVCSQSGRVGTPLAKLRHLLRATAEFCSLKRCSIKVLQKLVGLYVHPFTHRRELMCVFNRVYKQIERRWQNMSRRLMHASQVS